MLGASLLTGCALYAVAGVCGPVDKEAPSVVALDLLDHFFIAATEEGPLVVDLHVVWYGDILGAAFDAIATAGAESVHFFGDLGAKSVDVFVHEGFG